MVKLARRGMVEEIGAIDLAQIHTVQVEDERGHQWRERSARSYGVGKWHIGVAHDAQPRVAHVRLLEPPRDTGGEAGRIEDEAWSVRQLVEPGVAREEALEDARHEVCRVDSGHEPSSDDEGVDPKAREPERRLADERVEGVA
jgi:hypothetical protein